MKQKRGVGNMKNLLDEIGNHWDVVDFRNADPMKRDLLLNRMAQRGSYDALMYLQKNGVGMSGLDIDVVAEGITRVLETRTNPVEGIECFHALTGRRAAVPEETIQVSYTLIHAEGYARLFEAGNVCEALKLHQIYPSSEPVIQQGYRQLLAMWDFEGARKLYEGTLVLHSLTDTEVQEWYEKLINGPGFFETRRLVKKSSRYLDELGVFGRAASIIDFFGLTNQKPSISMPSKKLYEFYHEIAFSKYDLVAKVEQILPLAPPTSEMLKAAAKNGDFGRIESIVGKNPGLAEKHPELRPLAQPL